jgi:hypothetical protein
VILFCAATGIDHAAVGILAHAMQSMAVRGFIGHNRESGAYALTDSGRAALTAILEDAKMTKGQTISLMTYLLDSELEQILRSGQ